MLNFSRNDREAMLEKLNSIPFLEQKQKEFAEIFKKESEARRRYQMQ